MNRESGVIKETIIDTDQTIIVMSALDFSQLANAGVNLSLYPSFLII
jgi:hypothetical protein